jgi:hypothetical protein
VAPFKPRRLSNSVRDALLWWRRKIADASLYRQLRPIPELRDIGIYVDASTSWGIGIIIGERWHAFRLTATERGPDMGITWLEAVAIELVVSFIAQLGYTNAHILVRSDNTGAIGAHSKGRSPSYPMNLCARRTFTIACRHMILLSYTYVASADNLADAPSRGIPAPHTPPSAWLPRLFELPIELQDIFDTSYSPADIDT